MSVVDIRFEYIHVERAADLKDVKTGFYLSIEYKNAVRKGDIVEVPFVVYIGSKPEDAVSGEIRGTAIIQGDIDLKNPPFHVIERIGHETLYKTLFVLREIGAPPPFSLVPGKPPWYN